MTTLASKRLPFLRRTVAAAAAVLTALSPSLAQAQELPIIRDAEIEGLMRIYTRPLFRAAGLTPGAVKVSLIRSGAINAFVADGQRIFVFTGLLSQSEAPNEVIGVLAHETGHIAGGHLARMGKEIEKQSTLAIVGMLLGAAASVGSSLAGQREAAKLGTGIMYGGPGFAQLNIMSYARAQESAADQAAVKFLDATGQSAKGMLELFHKLATQSLASTRYVNPYVLSHPMPLERIRNLERLAKASANFEKSDPEALILRHELMQAKIAGFLESPQAVYRKYPESDKTLPAEYARAIVAFRRGDTRNALPIIDRLIAEIPQNPYFWELKGQALLEGGRPAEAVQPLKEAVKRLPDNGLILTLLAQAQLGTEDAPHARQALETLKLARRTENDSARLHHLMAMAYGRIGNLGLAELETAEAAIRRGEKKLATEKAEGALKRVKQGTPEWLRANDILNYTKKD